MTLRLVIAKLIEDKSGAVHHWYLLTNVSLDVAAEELKVVLVKLSGKSQKRGSPPTLGTLLSGLFVVIRIFDFLDWMQNDTEKINNLHKLLKNFLPKI